MSAERDEAELSESASPRRIAHAGERGLWPRSGELVFACSLLAGVLAIRFGGASIGGELEQSLREKLASVVPAESNDALIHSIQAALVRWLVQLLPVLLGVVAGAVAVSVMQVGILFRPENLLPDPARLNPLPRLQGIFSIAQAATSLRQFAKWSILAGLAAWWLVAEVRQFGDGITGATGAAGGAAGGMIVRVATKLAVALVIVGLVDYAAAWFAWQCELQMTRSEQVAEMKESEGDPRLRRARRQRQLERAQRRSDKMLTPDNVVIVAAGRLAVAVTSAGGSARITAKAVGAAADRLHQAARHVRATVIRDSSLARLVYRAGKVGDELPAAALAELAARRAESRRNAIETQQTAANS